MGNSDMHLKNFSLKETEPGSRNFQLSKAYDMLPVNVIMPEDKEQLALTINGKKRNIHKKEFRILAESCGIPLNSAERMMKKSMLIKGKTFYTDRRILPVSRAKRAKWRNLFQKGLIF